MLNTVDFYYFSPTGGTKKAGDALAYTLAETVTSIDLGEKTLTPSLADVAVVAVPVFGGRIPALVSEQLASLNGRGKKAVTAVVYGVRAYEDALLELNEVMAASGFEVIASAALIARHSVVPEVGAGRPDEKDLAEIQQFAKGVLSALKEDQTGSPTVSGNSPYRERMKVPAPPISLPTCSGCGHCVALCPMDAMSFTDGAVATDAEKCILCMACVAKCPTQSRALPPPLKAAMAQKLGPFKDVYRENEFFQ